jgi:hypothetical protein
MKKHIILTAALFFSLAATVAAQDSTNQSVTPATPVNTDKWNNADSTRYQLLPMPEPLTIEKTFPAIGNYQLTDKDGNTVNVTTMLDETNKGLLLVNGLPEGTVKAYLRKSPAVYKIPVQTTEDGKEVKEGVLIYDKDANLMNICLGCTYNTEDPATAFLPVQEETTTPEEEAPKKNTKTSKKQTAKAPVAKPVHYSGSKMISETASLK